MRIFEINFDDKKIQVENQWYTAEDLSRKIQQKLAAGDYIISAYSDALERLVAVVHSAREMKVEVTREMAESYEAIAAARGEPLQKVVREVLMNYLSSPEAQEVLFGEAPAEHTAPAP